MAEGARSVFDGMAEFNVFSFSLARNASSTDFDSVHFFFSFVQLFFFIFILRG